MGGPLSEHPWGVSLFHERCLSVLPAPWFPACLSSPEGLLLSHQPTPTKRTERSREPSTCLQGPEGIQSLTGLLMGWAPLPWPETYCLCSEPPGPLPDPTQC